MKPSAWLGLVIGLVGCSADVAAPLLDQPGDPCRSQAASCVDDETARECIDGVWVDRSCEDSCAERGPALVFVGCEVEPSEGCVCEPLPGYCLPGETVCESETEIALCSDAQVWELSTCEAVCADSLATPVSLGCTDTADDGAACWCEAA